MPVSRLRPSDPATIGPYVLLGRVAAGGMGVVYLGREDGRPDSLVAVKTARPDPDVSADFVDQLRSEARAATARAGGARPVDWLARLVEAEAEGDRPWIATEYVPGPSLHEAAGGRSLPDHDVTALAETLAEAIASLHRSGYAHRDVKPANIVMGPDGARLVDIGLAQRLGATELRPPMGSPGWSPPEQRDAGADPRPGDVHGWGMSVAYAACGRPAFGTGPGALVTRRMMTGEPRLSGIAEPLREVVTAALRPDPLSRPRAEDLVDLLATSPRAHAVTAAWPIAAGTAVARTGEGGSPPRTEALAPPTLVEAGAEAPADLPAPAGVVRRRTGVVAAAGAVLLLGALAFGPELMTPAPTRAAAPVATRSTPTRPAATPSTRATAPPRTTTPSPRPLAAPVQHRPGKHHNRKH